VAWPAQLVEALHILEHERQLGTEVHVGVALRRGPVNRDPEHVQARLDQTAGAALAQQCAVGDQLNAGAELLDAPDHLDDARVRGRLADAAEEDRGRRRGGTQAVEDATEGRLAHAAHADIPAVAHAGAAGDVAAVGRLDVDLVQVGDRAVQAQLVAPGP
jgi:hypothetical protein